MFEIGTGPVVFRMGGHDHGHGEPYQIPDYKTFKIAGIKQLEELEAALAKKNLKDPWIRYCEYFYSNNK